MGERNQGDTALLNFKLPTISVFIGTYVRKVVTKILLRRNPEIRRAYNFKDAHVSVLTANENFGL